MPRHVKIGEAKAHLSALLAAVEAGEDLVICRGLTPVALVTRITGKPEHAALSATLRRERAKQMTVTTDEILSWRHEGHVRRSVHPHASGEHYQPSAVRSPSGGSSPRERGTPRAVRKSAYSERFIPARAGNTAAE